MAIVKEFEVSKLEVNLRNFTISIRFDTVIKEDGTEILRKHHRKAFYPGQIEDVKSYTGLGDQNKHIQYLNALWTQAVIDAYNN